LEIRLESDGGFAYFPGLDQPVTVDTAKLAAEEAVLLESLVSTADFFEKPAELNAPKPGAADYRRYSIAVQDGERSHTVIVVEPVHDAAIKALIDYLRSHHKDTGTGTSLP